jgi:hypothetical protein
MRAADRITADAWTIPPRRLEAMMVVNFSEFGDSSEIAVAAAASGAHSPDSELQQEIEDLE